MQKLISVEHLNSAKSWPWIEARKVQDRIKQLEKKQSKKIDREIIFETGYGPSGLPHIGTFGEVVRTDMVRRAFDLLTAGEYKSRLVCFSDDMDAMRKVPSNVPNQEMLNDYINIPLSKVPDPFEKYPSFAAHNNAKLCEFLDDLGIDYTFKSSSNEYYSGSFNNALLAFCAKHDELIKTVKPTLREERQNSYSPFLPISPDTGKVLMVSTKLVSAAEGLISYVEPDSGIEQTTSVLGGKVKLQWKADWAMRWYALGVDYEMAGKDLIDSVKLSSKLQRIVGGMPPANLSYELFLDAAGEKISKSRGNGLSIEQWLQYGTEDSLRLFMFHKPATAKRLHLGIVPKSVDEFYQLLTSYKDNLQAFENNDINIDSASSIKLLDSPIFHIKGADAKLPNVPSLSYSLLLNLVTASGASDAGVLWEFVKRYAPGTNQSNDLELGQIIACALKYHKEFIAPNLKTRSPNAKERQALIQLKSRLQEIKINPDVIGLTPNQLDTEASAEPIQNEVYRIGKEAEFDNLRDWFMGLYEVLLGQSSGPRFGSLVAALGINRTCDLIANAVTNDVANDVDF